MGTAHPRGLVACVLASALCAALPARAGADQPAPPGAPPPAEPESPTPAPPSPMEPETPGQPAVSNPATNLDKAPKVQSPPEPPANAAGRWRYTAMLGVVSLPRVLALEPLGRYRRAEDPRWDLFSLGAAIEYLPPGIASFGGPKLSWMQLGVEGRWFFWRFLYGGLRAGWQYVRSDSEKFGSEVDYIASSVFVHPKVGALYTFDSGLTIGADVGATIPIAPKTRLESDGTTDSGARKVANTFGQYVWPEIGLFRIGYTF